MVGVYACPVVGERAPEREAPTFGQSGPPCLVSVISPVHPRCTHLAKRPPCSLMFERQGRTGTQASYREQQNTKREGYPTKSDFKDSAQLYLLHLAHPLLRQTSPCPRPALASRPTRCRDSRMSLRREAWQKGQTSVDGRSSGAERSRAKTRRRTGSTEIKTRPSAPSFPCTEVCALTQGKGTHAPALLAQTHALAPLLQLNRIRSVQPVPHPKHRSVVQLVLLEMRNVDLVDHLILSFEIDNPLSWLSGLARRPSSSSASEESSLAFETSHASGGRASPHRPEGGRVVVAVRDGNLTRGRRRPRQIGRVRRRDEPTALFGSRGRRPELFQDKQRRQATKT